MLICPMGVMRRLLRLGGVGERSEMSIRVSSTVPAQQPPNFQKFALGQEQLRTLAQMGAEAGRGICTISRQAASLML